MLFLTAMRRTAARHLLGSIARAVAFDSVPAKPKARRTRVQHLRNGVGVLLQMSSRLAWRPSLAVSLWYVTRDSVQSELRYGLRELGLALSPANEAPKRRALALAVVPSVAAIVAVAVRARRGTSEQPQALVMPIDRPVPARASR